MLLLQTIQPVADRIWRDRKCSGLDLSDATMSAPHAWPRKECQNCSWCAARIAKVKMITARIIEIDRALDQTQPEQSDVEIQVTLRIAGNSGDVMKSGNFIIHDGHTEFISISTRGIFRSQYSTKASSG